MKIVKFEKLLAQLPSEIKPYVLGKTLIDTSSHSGALVIKVGSEYYLKIDQTGALKDEAKNISWFYQAGLGIAPIAYVSSDKDYLLTEAAYGQSALTFILFFLYTSRKIRFIRLRITAFPSFLPAAKPTL